jgi:hypothetical protein
MLIATSLFSIVILTSTDIFIRVQRAQRTAAVLEKTQDTVRFFLTRISQEIQSGSIDYEYYYGTGGVVGLASDPNTKREDTQISSKTLALRTAQGERLLFTSPPQNTDYNSICLENDKEKDIFPCLVIATTDPATQAERMNPAGFSIQKLLFVITPGRDPFAVDSATNDYPTHAQPKVTMMFSVRSTIAGIKEPFDMSIQTTVSTREYPR